MSVRWNKFVYIEDCCSVWVFWAVHTEINSYIEDCCSVLVFWAVQTELISNMLKTAVMYKWFELSTLKY